MSCDTPVAFFVFNRPSETRQSFARIAALRPRRLFVIADGPRGEADRQRCDDTRAILRRIDWACDLRINFADDNMGCGRRVASGLDWVFQHVAEAIVLEDDCLPDATFFEFCRQLLQRYRDEPRVSMISGNNFQFGRRRGNASYYFSKIPHVWDWATWRRSWRCFDYQMPAWAMLRETNWLEGVLQEEAAAKFYRGVFDRGWRRQIDTWDIQWVFANFLQNGLVILPQTNLVTNIGFGEDATHTRHPASRDSCIPMRAMEFPLVHPANIERDLHADDFTFRHVFDLHPRRARRAA